MNYKHILKNGYEKLSEKLPETDKEFLRGFKYAIESLNDFKVNIDDYVCNDIESIAKIEREVAELTIDNAIEHLDTVHDEIKISFVDNNHFSIDENGNIVDDDE